MPITSELVKEFYAVAREKYGAEIIDKNNSDLMKLVAGFLDGIGVLDKTIFMKDFTTTIGKSIYCPFTPGVDGGASGYSLWGQVKILVHELTHVEQFKADPVGFTIRYVTMPSDRATYEAEAYSADLQLHHWWYGGVYDVKQRAQSLLSYGLKQGHCDYVAEYLAVRADIFVQGGATSEIATWAAQWLDAKGAK